MTLLAFDTATHATVAALRLSDGALLERRDEPAPHEHPGHATRLLAMCAELLAEAGVGWGELERIGVGLGPGRFTGLRVGIATARGLAQARSLELAGVPTLQTLGQAARTLAPDRDRIAAVVDARRGEVFAAAFSPEAGLLEASLRTPLVAEQLAEALRSAAGGGAWLAVGDGAARYRSQLEAQGIEVAPDDSALHRIQASTLCELALRLPATAAEEQVSPDYRRRPDAYGPGDRLGRRAGAELEGARA